MAQDIEFKKLAKEIMSLSSNKECFHEDKYCSSEIIRAHSIQNNRILDCISRNGEVIGFSPGFEQDKSHEDLIIPKKYGRKMASTFTEFCGYHCQLF